MPLSISSRSQALVQSEIRNMSIECAKLKGINLAQGVCDMELPAIVKRAAQQAMDDGKNHYTRYDGLYLLRHAIAEKMLSYNKIPTDSEKNVVVSAGATGAFYCACMALLESGDEVILFEPYYGYHLNTLLSLDIKPAFTTLSSQDWSIDFDQLKKIVTPKTKGMLINTPANPSGKVFSRGELEQLAEFAVKNDLFIFTDEIYERFLYEGREHVSIGSLPSVADRTITISGYSKTFNITGWRIGYAVCHEKWAQMIGYMNDIVYVCAPAPLQIGVARGIEELKDDYYENLRQQCLEKREMICSTLNKIGLTPRVPHGSYYVLADVSRLPGKNSKEKAMHILAKTGVATVPGSAFYNSNKGENFVRFFYARNDALLQEACERLLKLN